MGTSIERQKLDAFLAELAALSRKHGIWISGCGCCGSPILTKTPTTDLIEGGDLLEPSDDGTRYDVELTRRNHRD
jgi:hypothetical protein